MKNFLCRILIRLATALVAASSSVVAAPAAATPPNIVLIFCDDLGYADIGCFGSPDIRTPHIDSLSSQGVRLTQFYVTSPACTPSRAALLTGQYQLRVGLPNVIGPEARVGLRAKERTLAEALKEQGYATTCIGKWHLGYQPEFLPTKHGFDSYFGIPYSNDMDRTSRGGPAVPLMENEKIIEQPVVQDTLTQRYTARATKYIRDNAKGPFFLYLPHTFPHVPLHASEKFRGKSPRGLYGDVVEEIDWSTGEILKTLRELEIEKNTIVIFTSDNGPWLIKKRDGGSAGPYRDGKATVYEGGIRVPFIASWPGQIPAGSTNDEPTITLDLFPTLVKLAGGKFAESDMDGEDVLLTLTKGERRANTNFAFYRGVNLHALRIDDWKLHLPKLIKGTTTPMELYNMSEDPYEKENVAAANPDIVSQMQYYSNAMDADIRADFRQHPNFNEPDRISNAPASIADPTSTGTRKARAKKRKE